MAEEYPSVKESFSKVTIGNNCVFIEFLTKLSSYVYHGFLGHRKNAQSSHGA